MNQLQDFFMEGVYANNMQGLPSCEYPYGDRVVGTTTVRYTYDCNNRFKSVVVNTSVTNTTSVPIQEILKLSVFFPDGSTSYQKSLGSVSKGSWKIDGSKMIIFRDGYSQYLDKTTRTRTIINKVNGGYEMNKSYYDVKTKRYIDYCNGTIRFV